MAEDENRKSSQMSFAKMAPLQKSKKLKLSDREDALPPVNWSPQRPRPVCAVLFANLFFTTDLYW